MQVIIKGGFTYRAEFLIKEEAYAKLISAAETFGKDNASAVLGLYLESKVHNLKGDVKYAMMMLKDCRISVETHFPSNFVTITVWARECETEVDHCLKDKDERDEDVTKQLDDAFRWRADILDFISGELDTYDFIDNE